MSDKSVVKGSITRDGQYIQLVEIPSEYMGLLHQNFKKKIKNWRYHPKVKSGAWDGYYSFYDSLTQCIPCGLWNELRLFCIKHDLDLKISGFKRIVYSNFDETLFDNFFNEYYEYNKKLQKRDYQSYCIKQILKYKISQHELATSSGKTYLMFFVFQYLKKVGLLDKMLIVAPRQSLVTQTINDFKEYAECNKDMYNFTYQKILHGETKESLDVDLVVGTYQSLKKLPLEFYSDINVMFIDEGHSASTTSVINVIEKCEDAVYRIGLSGTLLSNDTAENYTIQKYLGPIVNTISAKFLIDSGYATPIKIKMMYINYLKDDIKKDLFYKRKNKYQYGATDILNYERGLVHKSKKRLNFIKDLVKGIDKNALILFSDVNVNKYGKKLYNLLRDNVHDKEFYYIDGSVKENIRQDYIKIMKEDKDNRVLLATFQTFSTGISINNIHYIFFIESYKSNVIIKQSLGRGMRLAEGKDEVVVYDIIDDYRYVPEEYLKENPNTTLKENYLYKHSIERNKIYTSEGHIIEKKEFNL